MADQETRKRARDEAGEHRVETHHDAHHHTDSGSVAASAILFGIGALIAPELLPGMVLGAGAVLASGAASEIFGNIARPLMKSAIRAGYAAATAIAEAGEQFQDAVAEVRAEHGAQPRG